MQEFVYRRVKRQSDEDYEQESELNKTKYSFACITGKTLRLLAKNQV